MRAPKFIRIFSDFKDFARFEDGDEIDLSFSKQRQRLTTYVVIKGTGYDLMLQKK